MKRVLQLAGDAPLREQLGRRGQEFVKMWFPVERMVEQIHSLYGRLLDQQLIIGSGKNHAKDN